MIESKVSVSVIMPTYNRGRIIARAIESVLSQTLQDFELLIIDDGSTDETSEVVTNYDDNRIRYYHYTNNRGANYARNYGIRKSRGLYIAFLDSDNKWDKDYLKKRVNKLKASKTRVGFVWGPVIISQKGKKHWILPDENESEKYTVLKKSRLIKQLLYENIIDTNTVVIKRECIETVDGFDESFKRLQDWELFIRILSTTDYVSVFDNEILVNNFIQKDSLGSNRKQYWIHRVKLIQKNKQLLEEYNCNNELLYYLINKENPKKDQDDLNQLLKAFSNDAIKEVLRELVIDRERLVKKIETKNDESIKAYNLHLKEYGIIEFQYGWIDTLIKNEDFIVKKLIDINVKSIAIYGYGWIGKNLYQLMKKSSIKVTAIIDNKYAGEKVDNIMICAANDFDDGADLVVVTVLDEFSKIKKNYQKNIEYISIKELVKGDNDETIWNFSNV